MVLDCALVLQLVFKGAGAWLSVFFQSVGSGSVGF